MIPPISFAPPAARPTVLASRGAGAALGLAMALGVVGVLAYSPQPEVASSIVPEIAAAHHAPPVVAAAAQAGETPSVPALSAPAVESVPSESNTSSTAVATMHPRRAVTQAPPRTTRAVPVRAPRSAEVPEVASASASELDALLDRALSAGSPTAIEDTLRAAPGRSEVLASLRSVEGAVSACGGEGTVVVRVTFASSGAVQSVTGADPSQLSCIRSAVSNASVAPFSRAYFSVSFPYRM